MKKSLIFAGMLAVGYANAQYEGKVGVNTETPKATLEVQPSTANLTGTTNEGLLIPRLSKERVAKMANPETSTLVYVNEATTYTTGTDTAADTRVANVDAVGFYHYNGTQWVKHLDTNTELWAQKDNNGVTETYLKPAAANEDLIKYRADGKFGINLGNVLPSSAKWIFPTSYGFAEGEIPVYTHIKSSRLPLNSTIGNNASISNTTKNLFNFKQNLAIVNEEHAGQGDAAGKKHYIGNSSVINIEDVTSEVLNITGSHSGTHVHSDNTVAYVYGTNIEGTSGNFRGNAPKVGTLIGTLTSARAYSGTATTLKGLHSYASNIDAGAKVNNMYGVDTEVSSSSKYYLHNKDWGQTSLNEMMGTRSFAYARPNSTVNRMFANYAYGNANKGSVVNEMIGIGSSGTFEGGATVQSYAGVSSYISSQGTEPSSITNFYGFRFAHGVGTGFSPTNMYGLYLADVNKGSTLNYAIYTNAGQVRLGDLKGIGERIVIADANGVLSTSSVATMGSKWTNDATNKVVKLTNLSNGTTERTENVGFYIKDNGMVGVGTATPVAPLHIISPSKGYGNDMIIEDYTAVAGDPSAFIFNRNRGTIDTPEVLLENDNIGQIIFATKEGVSNNYAGSRMVEIGANYKETGKGEFYINTSGTKRLSIDKDGNVGIGTASPAEKLHINGSVMATSYKGSNGATLFPDYVFQKYYTGNSSIKADYTFKTLSQVEDFVKTNGHLPGYKSAEAIKAQGYVDLMETQLTNVEKIEELYLHSIEQDKTNKTQAQEIETLRKENEELKSRLEKLEKLLK